MPEHSLKLYTSYWANKALTDLDAVKVSISRGQPRWKLPFRYRMAAELAPSKATFRIQDEREFSRSYRTQLDEIGLDAILDRLTSISDRDGARALVLLCFEPADQFCHRHVLRDYLRWENVPIRELQPGDLPRRHDTATPTLF